MSVARNASRRSAAWIAVTWIGSCGVALLGLVVVFATDVYGDEPPPPGQSQKSSRREASALDEELLKDLGPGLEIEGLDRGSSREMPGQSDGKKDSTKKEADPLEQELLKGLDDSDQPNDAAGKDPLARLSQQMRDVEAIIARQRADSDTLDRQTNIVKAIDDLIQQARKQRQGGGQSSNSGASGKGAQQATKRRESSQPQRRPGQENEMTDAPARESTKQTRDRQAEKPDMANMRDLLKGVWGQLPDRQREQMVQSYEEQFLPKYEQMIADYFRSLAEDEPRRP